MEATSKGAYSLSWMTEIEDALVELWSERTHLYVISSLEYADRAAKAAFCWSKSTENVSLTILARCSETGGPLSSEGIKESLNA